MNSEMAYCPALHCRNGTFSRYCNPFRGRSYVRPLKRSSRIFTDYSHVTIVRPSQAKWITLTGWFSAGILQYGPLPWKRLFFRTLSPSREIQVERKVLLNLLSLYVFKMVFHQPTFLCRRRHDRATATC